jgi:uncharacterized protein YbjT (DUF2867 family)
VTGLLVKMLQAKLRSEERLEASGIDQTIVRPNGFFSDMRQFLKIATGSPLRPGVRGGRRMGQRRRTDQQNRDAVQLPWD